MKRYLIIGDKNLSSWSMRPWLAIKHSGVPFIEKKILLDRPNSKSEILKHSPSARVPALIEGDLTIWDSLAICEYIHELAPNKNLLPQDATTRAVVRSYVAEMHSGFSALRNQLSMDIRLSIELRHITADTCADITRILELWNQALKKSGGPYLFGHFTLADAFFAPVVMRFQSYGIKIQDRLCQKYMRHMLKDRYVKEWTNDALKEKPLAQKF